MRKKALTIAVAGVLLASSLPAVSGAAVNKVKKKLDATYAGVKIYYNNQEVKTDLEPFIVNNKTYIPLRMMGEVFKKNVSWNGQNYTIQVTDREDSAVAQLQAQLQQKNNELAKLNDTLLTKEKKIRELEAKIDDLEEKSKLDLDDLEEELNDEFGEYRGIEAEISLSGDEEDLTVRIDVDMDDYEDEWDDLSDSQKEQWIEDMVDYIRDEYDDAEIDGSIRDGSRELLSFDVNSSGSVRFDREEMDLDDLEDELNDDYENYFTGLTLDIQLSGDEDDVTFKINLDYSRNKTAWDRLSDNEVKDVMARIYSDIEDEYEDADIEGVVYDTSARKNLATYERTSSGSVRFTRTDAY